MSQLFLRTLREDPADAEVPSHKWLVRAGYIRRTAPGIYTWLPLGLKVLKKVENIVREEMNAIGAQEVRFPALLPREPYEATNRYLEYGPNLFRLKDRKEADLLLGPTHEEMFTLIVKDLYNSYKDLPLSLYQIQTKYRDEARPRAGLLRGREFIMKDSYSFAIDDAGLADSYEKHRAAYIRVFDRLGLDYVIVKATSGAMGGSASEEFLAVAENGEDTFVRSAGGYAANVEAVKIPIAESLNSDDIPAVHKVLTPNAESIEELVACLNAQGNQSWVAGDTLKNVVFMRVSPDGTRQPMVIGLPGDREIDSKRLEAALSPDEAIPFTETDFAQYPQLVKGFIGPYHLEIGQFLGTNGSSKISYLVDPRVAEGSSWVTGANESDYHLVNLVFGRDFHADGYLDVAEIKEGDPAPDGSGALTLARGIEMGHIFQLGRKYAEALGLKVLDQNGKLVTVTMGSYGIGVSRAVAAVAEANCDDKGLIWPSELAPYDIHILATGKDPEVFEAAQKIANLLSEKDREVLLDDRKASPGVKFADSEILGIPWILVVGRGLKEGKVELRNRRTAEKREILLADAVSVCLEVLSG